MVPYSSAILGVVLSLIPLSVLIANVQEEPLSKSVHQDWTGTLVQHTLPDMSILSEYIAQTFSGSTSGASLQLSFVPRFNCTPVISVNVRAAAEEAGSEATLNLILDNSEVPFPALVDGQNSGRRFSFNADHLAQDKLRRMLDNSNRATFQWVNAVAGQGSEAGVPPQVEFSLLGSRMTTNSVESHCHAHKPIPFGE
jgi:hypothetical protein